MRDAIEVQVDAFGAVERRRPAFKRAQVALDLQIIKDSNFFCPQAEGTLQASAITASIPGSGVIIWNTPYARRLYYNPQYNFSKDKNPNARGKWFEEAKARERENWRKIAAEGAGGV